MSCGGVSWSSHFVLNVFKKLRLSLFFFDPTEETSGITGETFWKSLCLMTGERGIMENRVEINQLITMILVRKN